MRRWTTWWRGWRPGAYGWCGWGNRQRCACVCGGGGFVCVFMGGEGGNLVEGLEARAQGHTRGAAGVTGQGAGWLTGRTNERAGQLEEEVWVGGAGSMSTTVRASVEVGGGAGWGSWGGEGQCCSSTEPVYVRVCAPATASAFAPPHPPTSVTLRPPPPIPPGVGLSAPPPTPPPPPLIHSGA